MQLISALILGTASAVVAEQAIPQEAIVGISARQLFPAFGSALHLKEKRAETCEAGKVVCHGNCVPIGGQCCTDGWCERGTRCYGDGCCALTLKTCRSASIAGCKSEGKTMCQDKCIPIGATCCSNGKYCFDKAGTPCCIAGSDSRGGDEGGRTTATAAATDNANSQTGGAGDGSSPTTAPTTTTAPAAAGTVAVPMLLGAAAVMANLPLVM